MYPNQMSKPLLGGKGGRFVHKEITVVYCKLIESSDKAFISLAAILGSRGKVKESAIVVLFQSLFEGHGGTVEQASPSAQFAGGSTINTTRRRFSVG